MHRRVIEREIKIRAVDKDKGEIDAVLTAFGPEHVDWYNDVMAEGCLDGWLKDNDELVMLWGHDRKEIIGRWTDFKIEGDLLTAKGQLRMKVQRGKDAMELLKEEDVKGVSIGFNPLKWAYFDTDELGWGIEFQEIELREASLVLEPAQRAAEVTDFRQIRNADGTVNWRAVERTLTSAGLTRSESSAIVRPHLARVSESAAGAEASRESATKSRRIATDLLERLEVKDAR